MLSEQALLLPSLLDSMLAEMLADDGLDAVWEYVDSVGGVKRQEGHGRRQQEEGAEGREPI